MTEEQDRESKPELPLTRETSCVERTDGPVTLRLLDGALWQAFNQEGTEMIITKAGRRMFPFVMVTVEGLSPILLYSVNLSLVPCDHRQYKFCQRRWVSVSDTAPGTTSSPEHSYIHPASPNRGSFWCQEMISFAKLKITNNKHSQGDIVLQSMRKYMAQITVREDLGDVEYIFPFPETTFVAVTQYQNEAVTRMKIAHNPFANGFKYAHVNGSEERKKIFPKSDVQKCQKNTTSSGKPGTKTARVKATVTPQALTPGNQLSRHREEELQFASQEHVTLRTAHSQQPLSPDSLALKKEAEAEAGFCLPHQTDLRSPSGGFPVPSTVIISPYVFEPDEPETESSVSHEPEVDVENNSPSEIKRYPADENGSESALKDSADSEEEDLYSTTETDQSQTVTSCAVPMTVREADEGLLEPTASCVVGGFRTERVISVACKSAEIHSSLQAPSGNLANVVSQTETFKQPLPRKNSTCGKKNGKKVSSANGTSNAGSDLDFRWYRNALRQASQKQLEPVIKSDRGVQLSLLDSHIWNSFATCGSRMVISDEGRHMFPLITITLRGLDPGRLYSVWLHVTAADDTAYPQFREQGAWESLFPSQSPAPSLRPYMHPCSPMRGLAWMKVKVTFSDVKLTSDMASEDTSYLPLVIGKRYLSQIVVREEEEVTPGGAGSAGDLLLFPLPEVTFLTNLDHDDIRAAHPATGAQHLKDSRKRKGDSANYEFEEDTEESKATENVMLTFTQTSALIKAIQAAFEFEIGTKLEVYTEQPPSSKLARSDFIYNPWRKSTTAFLPRFSDVPAVIWPRHQDSSAILPRPLDFASRLNPVYCFPPATALPPAHVGLLASRMPAAPPLQSIASFPFQPQLFPQLRTPSMHSAFGVALPSLNPFPYVYYPYAMPSVNHAAVSDTSKGLDLSLKTKETR